MIWSHWLCDPMAVVAEVVHNSDVSQLNGKTDFYWQCDFHIQLRRGLVKSILKGPGNTLKGFITV